MIHDVHIFHAGNRCPLPANDPQESNAWKHILRGLQPMSRPMKAAPDHGLRRFAWPTTEKRPYACLAALFLFSRVLHYRNKRCGKRCGTD
jgi:hypothetical protein